MIIDMGGGTVDMTIHKVDSVMGQEMALTEVTHRECLPEVRQLATMHQRLERTALPNCLLPTSTIGRNMVLISAAQPGEQPCTSDAMLVWTCAK